MGGRRVGGTVAGGDPERLVTRWGQGPAPDERELARRLGAEGLDPFVFTMAPGETYGFHEHEHDEVRWVASGSVRFGLQGGAALVLGPGDRLDLPAGTRHDARTVGGAACTMVSAARAPTG